MLPFLLFCNSMSRWKKPDTEVAPRTLYVREYMKTPKGRERAKKHALWIKSWRAKNKERNKEIQRKSYDKMRLEGLSHYSTSPPQCACCGEDQTVFLSIDHIHGNGSEERRRIDPNGKIGGNGFMYWLKKNGWPVGYQVLCYNCNFAKRQGKECPHKTGATRITQYGTDPLVVSDEPTNTMEAQQYNAATLLVPSPL